MRAPSYPEGARRLPDNEGVPTIHMGPIEGAPPAPEYKELLVYAPGSRMLYATIPITRFGGDTLDGLTRKAVAMLEMKYHMAFDPMMGRFSLRGINNRDWTDDVSWVSKYLDGGYEAIPQYGYMELVQK